MEHAMVTRRTFLGQFTLAAGAAGLAGMLPRSAFAFTQGGGQATWAVASDVTLFARTWAARFTNALPNPLDPKLLGIGFVYRPDGGAGTTFTVTAGETLWNVLGPAGSGLPQTRVWGYGNYEGVPAGVPVTFPGRSFVVQRGSPIHVNWVNNLAVELAAGGVPVLDATGNQVTDGALPLSHLVGVDQTIAVTTDQTVRSVTVDNQVIYPGADIVGVPIAVHHHGGDTGGEFDGGPDQWQTPRRVQSGPGISVDSGNTLAGDDRLRYTYDNTQEASMHWYHDHGEGVTRTNAYVGLAGLYVVRDANEAALVNGNKIPGGAYELPLVVQDKAFAADGSLAYSGDPADYPVPGLNLPSPTHMPEVFGDIIVVNGVAWPGFQVEPREYRLRLLNGSDSRFYTLKFGFGGVSRRGGFNNYLEIYKISNDLGLLNNPVQMAAQTVTIAPGERMDVVVDFSVAQPVVRGGPIQVVVTNSAATPFPGGAPTVPGTMGAGTIMRFDVALPLNTAVPRTRVQVTGNNLALRGLDPATPRLAGVAVKAGTPVRRILLAEGADEYGRIMPLLGSFQLAGDPAYKYYPGQSNVGTLAFNQLPTETPTVGRDEVWEFWNTTVDAHPIHVHLSQFRVINREAFGPTPAAPLDPVTGLQMTSVAKDMVNGWSGSRLEPAYVALSGVVRRVPADEQGWKDTVVCYPGEVTRVLMNFKRPGKFVYHCHILSHEEHDMMRWFEVN
jgi:spore coat protein A